MGARGLFVTLEGGEGAGKSTQAAALRSRLESLGRRVAQVREPGGTQFGEEVRRLLLSSTKLTARTEMLLFLAARAELVDKVIRPSLARGIDVISDRYTDSTLAYQGYGHGISRSLIRTLNEAVIQKCVPDLTVLLDVPPGTGLSRVSEGSGGDSFEGHWQAGLQLGESRAEEPAASSGRRVGGRDARFHEQVREGYLELSKGEPERWLVLDGSAPAEEISRAIWERVEALLAAPS